MTTPKTNPEPDQSQENREQDQPTLVEATPSLRDIIRYNFELLVVVGFTALVLTALGIVLGSGLGQSAPSAPAAMPPPPTSSVSRPTPSATPAPTAPPAGAAPPVPTSSARPTPAAPPATARQPTPSSKPEPAPRPTPVPAQAGTYHTVVPGDTLAGIGLRYQVGYEQIAAANGVTDPSRIRPGQRLLIPQRVAGTVVIAEGDTLGERASRHGVTIEALLAVNPQITDPNKIVAGGQLRLPPTATPSAVSAESGATDRLKRHT